MELDQQAFARAYAQELGFNLAITFDWKPHEHPRNLLGRFIKKIGALHDGESIDLPDGVTVFRHGDKYQVGIGGTKTNYSYQKAESVAKKAFDLSAGLQNDKSIGGTDTFETADEVLNNIDAEHFDLDPKQFDIVWLPGPNAWLIKHETGQNIMVSGSDAGWKVELLDKTNASTTIHDVTDAATAVQAAKEQAQILDASESVLGDWTQDQIEAVHKAAFDEFNVESSAVEFDADMATIELPNEDMLEIHPDGEGGYKGFGYGSNPDAGAEYETKSLATPLEVMADIKKSGWYDEFTPVELSDEQKELVDEKIGETWPNHIVDVVYDFDSNDNNIITLKFGPSEDEWVDLYESGSKWHIAEKTNPDAEYGPFDTPLDVLNEVQAKGYWDAAPPLPKGKPAEDQSGVDVQIDAPDIQPVLNDWYPGASLEDGVPGVITWVTEDGWEVYVTQNDGGKWYGGIMTENDEILTLPQSSWQDAIAKAAKDGLGYAKTSDDLTELVDNNGVGKPPSLIADKPMPSSVAKVAGAGQPEVDIPTTLPNGGKYLRDPSSLEDGDYVVLTPPKGIGATVEGKVIYDPETEQYWIAQRNPDAPDAESKQPLNNIEWGNIHKYLSNDPASSGYEQAKAKGTSKEDLIAEWGAASTDAEKKAVINSLAIKHWQEHEDPYDQAVANYHIIKENPSPTSQAVDKVGDDLVAALQGTKTVAAPKPTPGVPDEDKPIQLPPKAKAMSDDDFNELLNDVMIDYEESLNDPSADDQYTFPLKEWNELTPEASKEDKLAVAANAMGVMPDITEDPTVFPSVKQFAAMFDETTEGYQIGDTVVINEDIGSGDTAIVDSINPDGTFNIWETTAGTTDVPTLSKDQDPSMYEDASDEAGQHLFKAFEDSQKAAKTPFKIQEKVLHKDEPDDPANTKASIVVKHNDDGTVNIVGPDANGVGAVVVHNVSTDELKPAGGDVEITPDVMKKQGTEIQFPTPDPEKYPEWKKDVVDQSGEKGVPEDFFDETYLKEAYDEGEDVEDYVKHVATEYEEHTGEKLQQEQDKATGDLAAKIASQWDVEGEIGVNEDGGPAWHADGGVWAVHKSEDGTEWELWDLDNGSNEPVGKGDTPEAAIATFKEETKEQDESAQAGKAFIEKHVKNAENVTPDAAGNGVHWTNDKGADYHLYQDEEGYWTVEAEQKGNVGIVAAEDQSSVIQAADQGEWDSLNGETYAGLEADPSETINQIDESFFAEDTPTYSPAINAFHWTVSVGDGTDEQSMYYEYTLTPTKSDDIFAPEWLVNKESPDGEYDNTWAPTAQEAIQKAVNEEWLEHGGDGS